MQKIPLEFVEEAPESYSIIESNLGEGESDLGGRADSRLLRGDICVEAAAMTPPVSLTKDNPAAGGRQAAREYIQQICNKIVSEQKDSVTEDEGSKEHVREYYAKGGPPLQNAMPFVEGELSTPKQGPRPFFGQIDPAYTVQREQPHHRPLLYLAAAGDTPAEIADKLGWTRPMVGYILKQPWALNAIAELQDQAGRKSVMNVLQGATLMAAERLIKIAEGGVAGAKISDSVNCAKEILSRVYGSAPQVVLTGKVDPNELTDAELASKLQGN